MKIRLNSPKSPQTSIFVTYGRMAGSDAWKMLLGIFQDFDVLKNYIV